MSTPSVSIVEADPALPHCLHVRAGGAVLSLPLDLLDATGPAGHLTPVPGAPEWLCGLGQFRGRLVSVVDAGRLFAGRPSSCRWVLALKGLPCEVALGVDELLGAAGRDGPVDMRLDAACLGLHPAFQPGAAGRCAEEP
jgi:hypothetical protein